MISMNTNFSVLILDYFREYLGSTYVSHACFSVDTSKHNVLY